MIVSVEGVGDVSRRVDAFPPPAALRLWKESSRSRMADTCKRLLIASLCQKNDEMENLKAEI